MNPVYIPAVVTFAIMCVLVFSLARKHQRVQALTKKVHDLKLHIEYLTLKLDEDSDLYDERYEVEDYG